MTLVPMPTAAFTLEDIEGDSDIKRPYEVVSTEELENAPMISMETIKQQS